MILYKLYIYVSISKSQSIIDLENRRITSLLLIACPNIDTNIIYTKFGAIKGEYRYMNTIALTIAFENRQKRNNSIIITK